jgi:hypothetical protein
MDKIEKLLGFGDLRTAGKSEEVITLVLANPELFENVIKAILSDNPGTRMRASDAVEKITLDHPDWLKPYKKLFLSKIIAIDQKEVKWHVAQILPRFRLTAKEREIVFNLMLGYLDDTSQIVKTFAMQALTDIAMQDASYIKRAQEIVKNLVENGAPSQRSRGKKLLASLESANS